MMLSYTSNEKTLLRYNHQQIDVFDLETCKLRFTCKGRLIGLSHDNSLMIVCYEREYQAYRLDNGVSYPLSDVKADLFPEHQRCDSGAGMSIFDVFTNQIRFNLHVPAEEGVGNGFERNKPLIRFPGEPYVAALGWYDTTWGEGQETHIYDLSTGKHVIKSHTSTHLAIEPKQRIITQDFRYGVYSVISLPLQKEFGKLELTEPAFNRKVPFIQKNEVDGEYLAILATHPRRFLTAAVADRSQVYILHIDILESQVRHRNRRMSQLIFNLLKSVRYQRLLRRRSLETMIYHPDGERLIMSYSGGHVEMLDVSKNT